MMGREERGEEGRKTTVRVVRRMGCRVVTMVSRMKVVSWPVCACKRCQLLLLSMTRAARLTLPKTRPALSLPPSHSLNHVPHSTLYHDGHDPLWLGAIPRIVDARPKEVTRGGGGSWRSVGGRSEPWLRDVAQIGKVGFGFVLIFNL